jgi:cystathionine beta-lyase/cystathionine gamma-synthase
VIVDAIANAADVAVADVGGLIAAMPADRRERFVVVDATGTADTAAVLAPPRPANVRAIAFESLTKFAQFGLDRVTAGMIVTDLATGDGLDTLREHLGTNIADASSHAIPTPDRRRLDRRLRRIGRNAERLAARLAETTVAGVVHPSSPGHPQHGLAAAMPFRGGWLALRLVGRLASPDVEDAFVAYALEEARVRRVGLAAGASFGLDVCRIYRIGRAASATPSFVRIAPGIEHRVDVERLGDAFTAALRRIAMSS